MERLAFERPLDVLEKNKIIEYGALSMLAAGPLVFVAFLAQVFPPGLLGVHLTVAGIVLWLANNRTNMRATRRRANVRADQAGVWVDGKLVVARAQIADGFFQPRLGRDPNKASSYGSSVRFVDKRRRVLFEAEAQEQEALEMLYALGLDPGSKRAEFRGSSPMYATLAMNMFFFFFAMLMTVIATIVITTLRIDAPIAPFVMVPLVLGAMWPSKIAVGIDGVLVRWMWRKKFTPMAQIARIERHEDRGVKLCLVDGSEQLIYTSMRRRSGPFAGRVSSYAAQHRDAVLARIGEAIMAYRARGPAADVSALVGKGTRSRSEWLAALTKLRDVQGGYRDAVVRDEDLWRVVEDPSAPEDARGGAAMLLRRSLDDSGRARVRVAAEATASPKLRVALDAAATANEDEAMQSALEELAGEDAAAARAAVR